MSLFGGSGFLGLGGTKLGDTATNIYEGAQNVIGDIAEFKVELPNKLIDLGESLGESTFDTSSETAQKFKQEAIEFRSRQAGSFLGQTTGNLVNFITNNIALIGSALIAYFIFRE